jgi:hypothetical protein
MQVNLTRLALAGQLRPDFVSISTLSTALCFEKLDLCELHGAELQQFVAGYRFVPHRRGVPAQGNVN